MGGYCYMKEVTAAAPLQACCIWEEVQFPGMSACVASSGKLVACQAIQSEVLQAIGL